MPDKPKQKFHVGDCVEYTDPYYPYLKIKGKIGQVNWSSDNKCWAYIFQTNGKVVTILGNHEVKMKSIIHL